MELRKYRTKPVILEGYQTADDVCIFTFEGMMKANAGDFIIIGLDGIQRPCKPDIFESLYDTVEENEGTGTISDGYHTFDELYRQRMVLFSVICNTYKDKAWKSWKHHDDIMYDDYFIVGITTPEGDYTYHFHKDYWDMFNVKELEKAPKWDGHQGWQVTRLLSLLAGGK